MRLLLVRSISIGWLLVSSLIVLLALVLSLSRVVMPMANEYRETVAQQISRLLNAPVEIGHFRVAWMGFQPQVMVDDLKVKSSDGDSTVFSFREMQVTFDLWQSLRRWQLTPDEMVLTGSQIEVIRLSSGQLRLRGLQLPASDQGQGLERLTGLSVMMRDITVSWLDEPLAQDYIFAADQLLLQVKNNALALDTKIFLPHDLGHSIHVMLLANGPLNDFRRWQMDYYVNMKQLDMSADALPLPDFLPQRVIGRIDLELWGNWSQQLGAELQGSLQLSDLGIARLRREKIVISDEMISGLRTKFVAKGNNTHWYLDTDQLQVFTPLKTWPEAQLSLDFTKQVTGAQLSIEIGYLDLNAVTRMAAYAPKLSEQHRDRILALNLNAELTGLKVNLLFNEGLQAYTAAGDVQGGSWQRAGPIPGVQSLDGQFSLSNDGGQAHLESQQLSFDYPRIFHSILHLQQFNGQLSWARNPDADGWRLNIDHLTLANEDVTAAGTVALDFSPHYPRPMMNLEVIAPTVNVAKVKTYLPYGIMRGGIKKWLPEALLDGQARNIRFAWQGLASGKALKSGETQLRADFDIENATLNYRQDWPLLQGLGGQIRFVDTGMEAMIDRGNLYTAKLQSGKVKIQDFFKARLEVQAKAEGEISEMLRYLREAPIANSLDGFLDSVFSKGNSALTLSLDVPLSRQFKRREVSIDGRLDLQQCVLGLPKHDVHFSELKGNVAFTRDTYSAKALTGIFRGHPVTADIRTEADNTINVAVEGRYPASALLPKQQALLDKISAGEADFSAVFTIPSRESGAKMALRVASNLNGIRLDLPQPLGKPAKSSSSLLVDYVFDGDSPRLQVGYAKTLNVLAELQDGQMQRAMVNLSGDQSSLPEKGIAVTGRWPLLDTRAWVNKIRSLWATSSDTGKSRDLNTSIGFDVKVDRWLLAGLVIDDAHLEGGANHSRINLNIDSPQLLGQFSIPHQWRKEGYIRGSVQRLHLPAGDKKHKKPLAHIAPDDVPALNIDMANFRRGDLHLDQVALRTQRDKNAQAFELYASDDDVFSAQINGRWTGGAKTAQTDANFQVEAKNAGIMLRNIGLTNSLLGGQGQLTGQVRWEAAPYDLMFSSLGGTLEGQLASGSITSIDSDFAKLIGLLNLDNLPRRLAMNFKDVAEVGFHYDTLAAQAEVNEGVVQVNDLFLNGPSAAVEMNGTTDLVKHEHNLQLNVIPKVKTAVPVAASFVAGIQTGVLVYIFEKLAEKAGVDLDRSVTLSYDITGVWRSPKITGLNTVPEDVDFVEFLGD